MCVCVCVVVQIMCFRTEEKVCIDSCDDLKGDGRYASCGDCRQYIVCKGGTDTLNKCPEKPNWGFNVDTRQCQYKSPHCFPCSGRLYFLLGINDVKHLGNLASNNVTHVAKIPICPILYECYCLSTLRELIKCNKCDTWIHVCSGAD